MQIGEACGVRVRGRWWLIDLCSSCVCARAVSLCNHRRHGSTSRVMVNPLPASYRRKISNLHVFTFDVSIAPVPWLFRLLPRRKLNYSDDAKRQQLDATKMAGDRVHRVPLPRPGSPESDSRERALRQIAGGSSYALVKRTNWVLSISESIRLRCYRSSVLRQHRDFILA